MIDSRAWQVTQLCGLIVKNMTKEKAAEAIQLLTDVLRPTVFDYVEAGNETVEKEPPMAWEPSVVDEAVGEYVWCDFYGSVHENTSDPDREGPVEVGSMDDNHYENNPGWAKEVREHEYGDRELWFFTCPGPHKQLQVKDDS